MGEKWRALKRWQKWGVGIGAFVVVSAVLGTFTDPEEQTSEPVAAEEEEETPEPTAEPTPAPTAEPTSEPAREAQSVLLDIAVHDRTQERPPGSGQGGDHVEIWARGHGS